MRLDEWGAIPLTEQQFLSQLDDDQRAAVTAPLGNILCVANAGSGKTRVLTYRVAYWMMQGVPEESFLMLTFTNKAAAEMTERIRNLLGRDSLQLTSGTFHSVANRFLRQYGDTIDLDQQYEIMDESTAKELMAVCRERFCAENGYDRDTFPGRHGELWNFYSYSRNIALSPSEANEKEGIFSEDLLPVMEKGLFAEYERRKRKMNCLDFDDLLIKFQQLLKVPYVARRFHTRMPNIFVDEYQDINRVQDAIIHSLADTVNSVTAVGDEAQCIYGFRGSEVEFIQAFERSYPDAKVFPIRNNYRSVKGIVTLATDVINKAPYYAEQPKEMFATRDGNQIPQLRNAQEEEDQLAEIVREVKQAHRGGTPYGEIAILVRNNSHGTAIERELSRNGVPVRSECGIKFFDKQHIRMCMSFLRLVYNRKDEMAFWNLLDVVFGIGPVTVNKILKTFTNYGCDLEALSLIKVSGRARGEYERLTNVLVGATKMDDMVDQLRLFVDEYYSIRMKHLYKEDFPRRMEDIEELFKMLPMYPDIRAFLETAALDSKNAEQDGEEVTISTIHKAKGLEWDKVILPFCNETVIPGLRAHDTEREVEEERRLMYVAITRARKEFTAIFVEYSKRVRSPELSSFLKGTDIEKTYKRVVSAPHRD